MAESRERRTILSAIGGRYGLLLAALFIVFALLPFLGSYPWVRSAVIGATALTVIAALSAIWSHSRLFLVGLLLGGGAVVALLLGHFFDFSAADAFVPAFKFCFLALVAVSLILDIARSRRVDMDIVFGACCVYLLIGLIWAALYTFIEAAAPGSFDFGPLAGGAAGNEEGRLAYFSFITMTTVGYGDVTPLSPPARTFAALQGLVGQLYLAIVVARLVGLEIANRLREGD